MLIALIGVERCYSGVGVIGLGVSINAWRSASNRASRLATKAWTWTLEDMLNNTTQQYQNEGPHNPNFDFLSLCRISVRLASALVSQKFHFTYFDVEKTPLLIRTYGHALKVGCERVKDEKELDRNFTLELQMVDC